MKYTQETKDAIVKLSEYGLPSRYIAKELGISKSGVNGYLQGLAESAVIQFEVQKEEIKKGPRIAIFDCETAAGVALTFGRFKVNLSQDNMLENGGWILCASWKWLGDPEIHSVALSKEEVLRQDDSRIVAALFEMYENSDAVVAHNGISFDDKVLKARALFNGFPALPKVKVLDTLQLAKKHLRLPNNKLDSIAEFFEMGRKESTGGIKLWKDVQAGDEDAMIKMESYCRQDVNLLEQIYLKLRGVGDMGSDFNAGLYFNDNETHCRFCGSTDVEKTGRSVKTSQSVFNEVRCNACGSVHREKVSTTLPEKRKTLLV